MFFLFDEDENAQPWMANTDIPLDALWIKGDRIIEIDHMRPCVRKRRRAARSGRRPGALTRSSRLRLAIRTRWVTRSAGD